MSTNRETNWQSEQELDLLLTAYKDAVDVPEASTEFLPNLWAKIEARRAAAPALWRWATASFVTASLALALVFTITSDGQPLGSYLDVLADSDGREIWASVATR